MTPKYWFRILAGMLAIFAVGMVIRAGVHKGRVAVTDLTQGSGSITIPLLGVPFRLGDSKLGTLQRLRIERSAPKLISGFHLVARVDDTVAIARLSDCRLTVIDPNKINEHTSFACATAADSAKQVLVPFGTVTLEPSGQEVVLLIPESVRRDIQKDAKTSAAGGNDSTDVNIDSANGSMDIKVNGKSILSMKGDSTGGRLVVHDEAGKEVVNMKIATPPKPPAVRKP